MKRLAILLALLLTLLVPASAQLSLTGVGGGFGAGGGGGGCAALQGMNITNGDTIQVYRQSDYKTWFNGVVTAYNSGTGALTLNVSNTNLSGTISDLLVHTVPPTVITGKTGGAICAADTSRFVWIPTNSSANAWYSVNGGSIWNTISGLPTDGWGGFSQGPLGKNCAADRVTANTFYLYNQGPTSPGLYTCTISVTPSCAYTFTSLITSGVYNQPRIKAMPGNAGYLFFSDGGLFKRSINGGTSWTTVADGGNNFSNVLAFGFGAAFPGQSFPAIYVQGANGSNFGFYRSIDNGTTWTLLATYPNGSNNLFNDVDGSKSTPGEVFIATAAGAFIRGSLNFLLKRDLDPASNDNDPMWLEKAA